MKNDEICKDFENGLIGFRRYKEDLKLIYKNAIKIRDNVTSVELKLKLIFRDIFPQLVLTNLAKFLDQYDFLSED